MDFIETQLLLHANIKYCTWTFILQAFVLQVLVLQALVYVLVTLLFFVLNNIFLVFLLCFGRYFFVKSTVFTCDLSSLWSISSQIC